MGMKDMKNYDISGKMTKADMFGRIPVAKKGSIMRSKKGKGSYTRKSKHKGSFV